MSCFFQPMPGHPEHATKYASLFFHFIKFLEALRRPGPFKIVVLQDQINIDKNGGSDIYRKSKSALDLDT